MKKFIFSGTTKANYALLAETGSAFFLMQSNRRRRNLAVFGGEYLPAKAGRC
jgi:hypothetical protein